MSLTKSPAFDSLAANALAQASFVAGALTVRTVETRDLSRFSLIEDKGKKLDVALRMLAKLKNHQGRLRENVGLSDTRDVHIMRALENGDSELLAELGLDLGYSWVEDILAAMINGFPFVEIETCGPHAARHVSNDGDLNFELNRIPNDERVGVILGAFIRDISADCENVRMVTLVDDLHDYRSGEYLEEPQRDQYVVEVGKLLLEQGIIRPSDIPGVNYVLLRESELLTSVDDLIASLRSCGLGLVETTDLGDIVFRPSDGLIRRLALTSEYRKREFR